MSVPVFVAQEIGHTFIDENMWMPTVTIDVSESPEIADLAPEVRAWEPHLALTPGGDGLQALRVILAGARAHLGRRRGAPPRGTHAPPRACLPLPLPLYGTRPPPSPCC